MSHIPEYEQSDEFKNRSRKLSELQELKLDAYPNKFEVLHHSKDLHKKYDNVEIGHSEDAAAGTTDSARVAGRLVLFRSMGKNAFGHIQDATGRIQIMFNRDLTEVEGYNPNNPEVEQAPKPLKLIEKKFDLGDIIGIEGHLFHTQKGELTIYAKKVTLLCKTLLPLADKHAGLADKELRYRKRWLDLISNEDVRDTFRTRTKIMRHLRRTFEDAGFLEVETPVLQSIYGGAEARPFETVLHALHQDMFMRISLEIPLKKLIVGGMDRVFEVGRVFRNEGIDRTHNPEFTLLEAYAAYWDYNDMMSFLEKLMEELAIEIFGTTTIKALHPETGEEIDIETKAPWPRYTIKESLKKFANLDVDQLTDDQMREILLKTGNYDEKEVNKLTRGLLMFNLFEEKVEHQLIQPTHIIDFPIETTPLCKLHRDPAERANGIVERFESFLLGGEICNAYSELNDPQLQKQLLEEQAKKKQAGDFEANPYDSEFIEAICQGMPPTGGIGIGVDRLIMLFTGKNSIRDVLFFPWMKPLESKDSKKQ